MHYQRIVDERELAEALTEPGAAILCGGTDLLVRMRSGLAAPERLLDISHVDSLRGIREIDERIEIGAATPESDLARSPLVRERLPLLASALDVLGSIQIRNRGSLGGNVVNASPAADSAVPLLAYDADLLIVGPTGERTLALGDFFVGPGKTALTPGEYVRTLHVPMPDPAHRVFYHKVGKRRALTIAIASVGIAATLREGRLIDVRIAAGSVAPTPIRLRDVEGKLADQSLDETLIDRAGKAAAAAVSPIDDVRATAAYRRSVVGDLVARGLRGLLSA